MAKGNPEKAHALADQIIRNTYRTLMTRGQKGCFIFCTDPELNKYFRERLNKSVVYDDLSPRQVVVAAEDRSKY
jgi:uncharacterized protein